MKHELDWIDLFLIPAVKVLAIFGALIISVPVTVLAERKILGYIQQRPGPNRVGPWGLFQTIVDGIKLLLKEEFTPGSADMLTFLVAPVLALVPSLVTMLIVPLAPEFTVNLLGAERVIDPMGANLPIGILFYFAMTSLGVYGIVLAGWASNSKYALLGGIRSSAQLISYELTLGMSLVGVLLITGSFGMRDILANQDGILLNWHVFSQPLGFLMFLVGGFAETNRLPFDLPEGESELGAGYHTEYSSMKWGMFQMAEYINIVTFAAIISTLFLGGYYGPYGSPLLPGMFGGAAGGLLGLAEGLFWLSVKIAALFFFFVWVRGTLPRLRYDQLMNFGWKVLFPLGLVNTLSTAVIIAMGLPGWLEWLFLGCTGLGIILFVDHRSVLAKRKVVGNVA